LDAAVPLFENAGQTYKKIAQQRLGTQAASSHQHAAAGESPLSHTGALRDAVDYAVVMKKNDSLKLYCGVRAPKNSEVNHAALAAEFGTATEKPHPFIRPSIIEMQGTAIHGLANSAASAVEEAQDVLEETISLDVDFDY